MFAAILYHVGVILYMFLSTYTGNARVASIYSQVLLLFAYIVCLLVSERGLCKRLHKQHYDK